MRFDGQLLTAVLAGRGSHDELERIFRIDSQPGNLCSLYGLILGDDARLRAITIKTQTPQIGSCKIDLIPFEDYRRLCSVPATEDRWFWRGEAVCAEDGGLERCEGFLRGRLGRLVPGDGDVDYGARCYGGWEED